MGSAMLELIKKLAGFSKSDESEQIKESEEFSTELSKLPDRYSVKELEEGKVLSCL